MSEGMTDPAMVEAVLARVPGAGRAFIACHDAFVRKTVLRASPAAASLVDDLTHDVYVHLWGNDFRVLRQWQREHALRAYLGTIATRLVWDRLGRLQPVWELIDEDPFSVAGTEPCDLAPTPEDEVAAMRSCASCGTLSGGSTPARAGSWSCASSATSATVSSATRWASPPTTPACASTELWHA
jgi:DNA-directed RNA polymerase specialized sigma24 family protein